MPNNKHPKKMDMMRGSYQTYIAGIKKVLNISLVVQFIRVEGVR